ncbi:hypothetical protein MMC21_003181 [Puttea exsequens]|nr:hypothetical protein [Puttea exsequens]
MRDRPRKIYDIFLVYTEFDFFEIRLNELDKEIYYFIILESTTTFQMSPKPLHLKNHSSQFESFQHKIIYEILDDSGARRIPIDDTWEHERYTRNALFDQVILPLTGSQAPHQGDALLIGEIGETSRGELWHHPQVTNSDDPEDTVRLEDLRSGEADVELDMSWWYCSSCFGPLADLKNKITSFSHKGNSQP